MSSPKLADPSPDAAGTPNPTPEPPEKSVWHYLGLGLSGGILMLVIALAAVLIVVPKIVGATPLTVLTSSMEPGLPPGTLIVVRPVDVDELMIGDVVTYQIRSGEPDLVTHRIIAINASTTGDRTFVLQGDNNSEPDAEAVIAEQVQGRVWYSVPLVGFVNTGVNGANKVWIIPLAAGGLFAYAASLFIGGVRDARRKRRTASLPKHIS